MVLNKKDLEKAFSPRRKPRKFDIRSTLGRGLPSSTVDVGTTSDVKVFIRVRPFSERESGSNNRSIIKVVDDKMLIFDPKEEEEQFFFHGQKQKSRDICKKANKEMEFVFNRVFSPEATNNEVFESTTKNIITSLLEGYNCSVFVYGATGAGKTHTMLGNKDNPGITYLTMVELYNQVEQMSETKEFQLGVSYLEVYNENVHDLLQPSSAPMHLREDSNSGVTVAGLKVTSIRNANQLFELLEFGNKNRTQHPTDANAESSRSHAVFQVYIRMAVKQGSETKLVKLSMIDLAGSERGLATGCSGSRFKEGSNINKSLLALGNCINNLADGLKHIPYRDSKLTRLLKDSLGGNCQTVMIANVSPSLLSYEDTYNTLKYATRAKNIKTKLSKNIVSVEMHVGHYIKIVEELRKDNAKLKNQIKTLELATTKTTVLASPIPDPRQVEKMCTLFKEKKEIHGKLLTLESQEKTLEWRIRHKQLIAFQLSNIKADDDDAQEGINRVQQTLRQLEARAKSVRGKITETLKVYNNHKIQFRNFTTQLEGSKTAHLLEKDMTIKDLQVVLMELKIQMLHHQKIIQMQDKRHESHYSIITNLSGLNSRFYLLLKGHNHLTSNLEFEYQTIVRMLEGVKGVSWTDIDDGLEEEEGTTFSSASVRSFMNLTILYQRMPEVVFEDNITIKTEKDPEAGGDAEVAIPGDDVNSTFNIPITRSFPVTENFSINPPSVPPISAITRGPNFKTPSTTTFKMPTLSRDIMLRKNTNTLSRFSVKKENSISNARAALAALSINKTTSTPKALLPRPINSVLNKSAGARAPLKTLKMNRINARHSHHPYMTPKSSNFQPYTTPKSSLGVSARKIHRSVSK